MREDYKNDWADASLVKDLNYLKTGVEEYDGKKVYYSTGSIKDDSINSEGSYTYSDRPSRANRVGQIGDIFQARMKDTDKAVLVNNDLNNQLFSTGFFQIRTDSRVMLPKYLFHYFKSFIFLNQKDSNCSGSTQSALNDKSAKNLIVPVAPISIQQKIVSKLEELFSDLDKGIADLKKAQDQLKVYRQAVLKKAFEGELTKEWREQQQDLPTADELLEQIKEERQKHYEQQLENWKQAVNAWEENDKEGKKPGKPKAIKSVEQFTRTEIKSMDELPNKWNWVRLGNVFQVFVGSTPSRSKTEYWENGKINWVSSGEVTFSSIFETREKITNEGLNNASTTIHPVGTVMLAMIGEGKTRGQAGILEIDACHNQNTAAIRVSEIGFLPKFLFHYLFLKYERNRSVGSGNNQKALNQGRIMDFDYPLCSVEEQHQIIQEIESRLSVCEKVEESIIESLEKAKALRQSVLKKAFEGTLLSKEEIAACKAAPDYEPASVLLEKIKAEKKKK